MSQRYSEETQKVLNDFLEVLSAHDDIDPDFLAELHRLTTDGELDNRTQIRQAVAILEAKADES